MRALSLGYTYQPKKQNSQALPKASGLNLRLRLNLILKLVLLTILFLPWGFTAYRSHQLRQIETEIRKAQAVRTELLSKWNRLTSEEVVKAKVAPMGLFKPTEKEIIRLP